MCQVPRCLGEGVERAQCHTTVATAAWDHAATRAVPGARDAERGPSVGRRGQPLGTLNPLTGPQLHSEEGAGASEKTWMGLGGHEGQKT